jgi:ribosome-binding ATPase YchF (GTP1/OBG family)
MRILALHGKRQNAEVMRTRLGRLVPKLKKIGVDLFIAEAPHDLPMEEGDSVPMKTWFERNANYEIEATGSASLETTLEYIDSLWQDAQSSNEPFSGVFGFSQGGTLGGILAMMPKRYPGLQFACIIGAPDNSMILKSEIPPSILSLHMGGSKDSMVPIENCIGCSRNLAEKFESATFIIHEQGHCIPSRAADMRHIVAFWEQAVQASSSAEAMKEKNDVDEHPRIGSEAALEGQLEELEALQAIYEKTLLPLSIPTQIGDRTLSFSITLTPDTDLPVCTAINNKLKIVMIMPSLYLDESEVQQELPSISLDTSDCNLLDFPLRYKKAITAVMLNAAQECAQDNMQCSFNVIQAALDWLQDESSYIIADSDQDVDNNRDVHANDGKTDREGKNTKFSVEIEDDVRPWYDSNADEDEESEKQDREMISLAFESAAKEHRGRLMRLFQSIINEDNTVTSSSVFTFSDEKDRKDDKEGHDKEEETEEVVEEEEDMSISDEMTMLSSASSRGIWPYCVGLIGKPSAGKSSLFNVLQKGKNQAEIASHPFTTINPNIGYGYFRGPRDDDKIANGVYEDSSILRDSVTQRRLLPVTIKDVAGLVPGAYKGRGKGNQFLNDLVDADALIHVVDVSGRSDDDGNIVQIEGDDENTSSYSGVTNPIDTASWIREEVHRWIYNNARSKWHTVVRRGALNNNNSSHLSGYSASKTVFHRVYQLFSGYHCTKALIRLAACKGRLNVDHADKWDKQQLHTFVAHFLLLRFPICLALNKVDLLNMNSTECKAYVADIQMRCIERGELAIPISAASELYTQEQEQGETTTSIAMNNMSGNTAGMKESEKEKFISKEDIHFKFLEKLGGLSSSTGVLAAISAAVAMRPPLYVYPVSNIDTLSPLASNNNSNIKKNNNVLRDVVLMKPRSTIGDLVTALKDSAIPNLYVRGEFVRACGRQYRFMGDKKKQLGRDSIIDEYNIIEISMNKKSVWQQKEK